jgi:hypothetical protein
MLGVVDVVIVVEVDAQTKVFDEPLVLQWLMKAKQTLAPKELT